MLNLTDLRGRSADSRTVLPRAAQNVSATVEAVTPILQKVQRFGVSALMEFSEQLDGVRPKTLRVPESVMETALDELDDQVRAALETLIDRAREVHTAQLPAASMVSPGPEARVTNRWIPVERVGLYVPGGQALGAGHGGHRL